MQHAVALMCYYIMAPLHCVQVRPCHSKRPENMHLGPVGGAQQFGQEGPHLAGFCNLGWSMPWQVYHARIAYLNPTFLVQC